MSTFLKNYMCKTHVYISLPNNPSILRRDYKTNFTFQSQIKVLCHTACGTLARIHNTNVRYLYQNVTRGAFV